MNGSRRRLAVLRASVTLGAAMSALALGAVARTQQTLGLSADDLRGLIYGDAIPGFRQVSAAKGADGPQIMLDIPSMKWGPCSWIEAVWVSGDGLTRLEMQFSVCASREAAYASAERFVLGISTRPREDDEGARIGCRSWSHASSGGAMVSAIIGRTRVFVNAVPLMRRSRADSPWAASPLDASIEEIVRALARGIEWNIRQRPELLARPDGTERRTLVVSGEAVGGGSAMTYRGTTWARLGDFAALGATVTWDPGANRATVSYRGRTLQLRACHNEARCDGRRVPLGGRVLLGADTLIVPLRKVAEALGMKVRATKTAIEIG
ncbi:MAG: copper amine oxidase N-terminal domain-containing protein [Armatimonadetes bacterium]|nr:copper amine oxidase N-terminal domain-containing protein [Armatimonadota bacterium]